VAFRKVLPVLALVVMMAAVASAQNATFQCAANAGVPPLIRAEGLAEPVGDLTLNCTGGDPNQVYYVNVQIFLSTNVTSNILAKDGAVSEALLMIDDPQPGNQCLGLPLSQDSNTAGCGVGKANIWEGEKVSSSPNSVLWRGIPIVPSGTQTRVIRIANIRANATGVPSGSYVPGTITEYISITGATSVPVANQPQTVAFVQQSLAVSISGASGKQCTKPGEKDVAKITFTENFPSAFRKVIETDNSLVAVEQNIPGYNYVTESMFTNSAVFAGVGVANQGTRFIVKFTNVQNGVTVSVPEVVVSGGSSTPSLNAYLVTGNVKADGSGGSPINPAADADSTEAVSISGGAGFAVYEVVGTGNGKNGLIDTDKFAITVTFDWPIDAVGENKPALGTSQIAGGYGPISTVTQMDWAAPEPRFKESFTQGDMLTISACRTILLFPFITNQVGFDTGIVIANTSSDPLAGNTGRQQQGACTMYYYGTTSGGGAAPAAQTSQVVPTGAQLVFTLSGGGNLGATGAPGFQGYMFALCNFQFAHGYAFVTKMGAVDIAHGYLALVVPDRTRVAQAFSNVAAVNDGEQLGY
ncbi:MAG: hypothetical protein LLG20_25730, partial [Acidobacteriales bacterium]|nr:hypothetical protein [Terriglobales bacterium]